MTLSAWIEGKQNIAPKAATDISSAYKPTSPKAEDDYRQPSPCGRTLCIQSSCVAFYCPEPPSTRCSICHQKIADIYGNLPETF